MIIEHTDTDEYVCPWCGREHKESYEAGMDGKWLCDQCGKYYRHESCLLHTTRKIDKDTPDDWCPW